VVEGAHPPGAGYEVGIGVGVSLRMDRSVLVYDGLVKEVPMLFTS